MTSTADPLVQNGADRTGIRQLDGSSFLTVPQLAQLLHVNEKKIYQLAGVGEIPGTKVTGKWIFPRQLIEDWLLENSHGGVMHDRLLIAGSDDRLIQQLCNTAASDWQQQALISYSPTGTRHGLRMLDTGRVDACFINWGASEASGRRHLGLLRRYRNHQSWVIVRCLQRNQGLLQTQPVAESPASTPADTIARLIGNTQLRWAMRPDDSGTTRLLEDLCSVQGNSTNHLQTSIWCDSETTAAAALNRGQADLCCAGQSIARDFGLHYLPVADVSLDLVMSRKTYFRTLVQDFIARLLDSGTHQLAENLGGYTVLPASQLLTID
ncbi:substrate-binding domain-containing protein [Granulosicoccus sp. 3-233]|uniref:substrate-binding domain-containing protein n=1 Tax=Granulosicoccus sp. 3-233 TaxID=3417969 RepID=UPI003D359299